MNERLNFHGDQEVGDGLVDLAVNVRLPAPPAWLAQVIIDSIGELAAYPRPNAAIRALAEGHAIAPELVLPTSGGAEAFTLLARGLGARRACMVRPQFTEPEVALERAGVPVVGAELRARDGFALRPELVDPEADLVLIGNPTNPTGALHRADDIRRLCRPGRIVVVDEAFMDAVPGEPESLIAASMEGLLVLRSLTKTWGIAGLRAGYAVGAPEVIRRLAAQQPHWSVSTPALAVMTACTTEQAKREAAEAARQGVRRRAHLGKGLTALGLAPVEGVTPFVLVRVGAFVREALRTRGFAVRRCDTFPGLGPEWIRIAVREESTSDAFLAALREVLDEFGRPSDRPVAAG